MTAQRLDLVDLAVFVDVISVSGRNSELFEPLADGLEVVLEYGGSAR